MAEAVLLAAPSAPSPPRLSLATIREVRSQRLQASRKCLPSDPGKNQRFGKETVFGLQWFFSCSYLGDELDVSSFGFDRSSHAAASVRMHEVLLEDSPTNRSTNCFRLTVVISEGPRRMPTQPVGSDLSDPKHTLVVHISTSVIADHNTSDHYKSQSA